jgi:hypothetical protein
MKAQSVPLFADSQESLVIENEGVIWFSAGIQSASSGGTARYRTLSELNSTTEESGRGQ